MSRIDYSDKHVLLVESSGNMRSAISHMLRGLGIDNLVAVTASRRVLELLEEREFDVVLLGYNVSDVFNGMQILEEVRFRQLSGPETGWIFMTSDASQATVLHAIDCKIDFLLTKPFSVDELKQRIDQLLERKQGMKAIYQARAQGDDAQALRLCLAAADRYDDSAEEAQVLACRLLIESGELSRAERLAEQVYWRTLNKEAGLALADAIYRQHRYAEAIEELEKLLAQYPLFLPAYDLLAEVQEIQGQVVVARDTIQLAARRSPFGIPRQMELGRLAAHTNEYELAAGAYRKSIQLGSRSCYGTPEPYLRLANIRRLELRNTEGVKQKELMGELDQLLDHSVKRFRGDQSLVVQAALLRSEAFQEVGDTDEATRQLRLAQIANEELSQALDLEQQRASLLRGGEGKKPPEPVASKSDKPPVSKAHDMSLKVNGLGVQHYVGGKMPQALKCFGLAIEYDLTNSRAALNLAQVFLESARDNTEKRQERLRMVDRYLKLASGHRLDAEGHAKMVRLRKLRGSDIEHLPAGSLGELLA
ncbi:response regulator [Marinobacterium jannaschii]|uniref:response regulator n=1 Tax=Marinobacterium jannaschii TaxID=64970 RepID=UPI0012EC9E6A|nr:response regulator [Marinobacterium jannaschii]